MLDTSIMEYQGTAARALLPLSHDAREAGCVYVCGVFPGNSMQDGTCRGGEGGFQVPTGGTRTTVAAAPAVVQRDGRQSL